MTQGAETEALLARYEAVQQRIGQACEKSRRDPDEVTLLAVSKRHPVAPIEALYHHGHRDFGENYVQEWMEKRDALTACEELRWHAIGPLQRKKSKQVAGQIALIHTLHTIALAEALEARAPAGTKQPVLLQVNASQEDSKSGFVSLDELNELFARDWEHLQIEGLMAIPPYEADPEASRGHFQELRRWRDALEDAHGVALAHLSMGMSHDLEVAIEEGATIVRVGTAIFGARPG